MQRHAKVITITIRLNLEIMLAGLILTAALVVMIYANKRPKVKVAAQPVWNVKALDLGLIMYENDFDNWSPKVGTLIGFKKALDPYVRCDACFFEEFNGQPDEPNYRYFGIDMKPLKTPEQDITIYSPEFISGYRQIAFADGHAKPLHAPDFQKGLLQGDRPGL